MSASQNTVNQSSVAQLEAPRFENGKPLLIAGLRQRYTAETMDRLPSQWQRFAPYIGKVPGQVDCKTYGLCFLPKSSQGTGYLTGVEVSSCAGLPSEFSCVSIPAQKYAVFQHREHVATVWDTCDAIGNQWLPKSGLEPARAAADAPDFFERYTEDFDPRTGMGGIEIWVPIK